jgi:hypothetical protein
MEKPIRSYTTSRPLGLWSSADSKASLKHMPVLSACRLKDDIVYPAYSCYTQGPEAFNATYQLSDRVPVTAMKMVAGALRVASAP